MSDTIIKEVVSEKKYANKVAMAIATKIRDQVRQFSPRCEIGGSTIRGKEMVKDIELIALTPTSQEAFEGLAKLVNQWPKIRGDMKFGKTKYTQRLLSENIKLDLFFCTPENWGNIYLIRVGSADYVHNVIAKGWVRRGFKSIDGFLWRNGQRYECREEQDVFKLAGVPWVPPNKREFIN